MPKGSEAGDLPPEPINGRPLERRQLTIMFTDLVDSTGLADSMDPEDFRTLIEAHRTIAVAPILRYGGVVARYLGDGMLVLFGYPEAHEDDPERAVRAGLEVASATESMNSRWVGEGKGRIAVRIGVHTGIVVIGDVLKADVQEIMAVFGNAPSIASRLQALARQNGVVLSGATKALLPPSILCGTRGNTALKGLKRPVEVFAAIEVREGAGDRRVTGVVLPFVNREKELAVVRQCWAGVRRGKGRSLLIEGEPGIGKSRLIRAVEERIVTQPSHWLITRTSPYAASTDFFAFSELFRRLVPIDRSTGTSTESYFDRLRRTLGDFGAAHPNMVIGVAGLLNVDVPSDATAAPLQPEHARELTLQAIAAWLQHEAKMQPLVLVIEDLHWADASTLEAIDRLKESIVGDAILLILTRRARAANLSIRAEGDQSEAGDLTVASVDGAATGSETSADAATDVDDAPSPKPALAGSADTVCIQLDRLRPGHAEDLLGHVLRGADVPKSAVTALLQRANGVPLYLEELPKPVLEPGAGAESGPIVLPATLRDSLMSQLDRMGEAKSVAQTAAVLGHSFERSLLEHVWTGGKRSLETGLATLADAALLRRDGGVQTQTYGFRHALLAEIAYDSLLRDDRRRIHRKTAEILAKHFQHTFEKRPEILGRHHEAAGNYEAAFKSWLKAGETAARRSANSEALEQFKSAEACLDKTDQIDGEERDKRHLALLMARAPVQVALLGWSAQEVEETYSRAWEISRTSRTKIDDRFSALGGLYNVYLLRGDLEKARSVNDQEFRMAKQLNVKDSLPTCQCGTGYCDFLAGNFNEAERNMGEVLTYYTPDQQVRHMRAYGTQPAVIANSARAWSQWFLGRMTKSENSSKAAIRLADDASHPFSSCYALCFASSIAQCRGELEEALDHAEKALKLASEYSFPYWIGWSSVVRGWSIAGLGDPNEGISCLNDGLARYKATGAAQMLGYMLCLAADAYRIAGKPGEAVEFVELAIRETKRTGIRFYQAEAYRLLGELWLSSDGDGMKPLRASTKAMCLAKGQQSLPLQLKAMQTMLLATNRKGLRSAIERRQAYISELLDAQAA